MSPSPDPAKYQREYWHAHPEHRKRVRENQKRRALENHQFIADYLREHPCVDCGEKDIVVLQFDHVRGKRKNDVTGMSTLSLKNILLEIAKCEVVCANCHTRRTAKRANTIRWRLANGVS
jgi:hypothetical protein